MVVCGMFNSGLEIPANIIWVRGEQKWAQWKFECLVFGFEHFRAGCTLW